MKNLIVSTSLAIVLVSSCVTQKNATYNDDVYANPKQDRIEEARLATIAKQEREAREKRYNDSIAAIQKAKDDANPYYKDREFKYDDYYDYEYATRIRRFDNNINGLGYYDNYYTNSYWYSGNPYNYGISIYNGYSWWGPGYNSYSYFPSLSFYYNWGWGCSPHYGYGAYYGYNPYLSSYWQGYYNGYYNGMWGNPYYGYGYGYPYYGGWGSPYYNGWGYYNAYDLNSGYATYGPRTSHSGGNSRRVSNPGATALNDNSYVNKFMTDMNNEQTKAIKFAGLTPTTKTGTGPVKQDKYGNPINQGGVYNPTIKDGNTRPPKNDGGVIKGQPDKNPNYNNATPIDKNDNNPTTPVKPNKTYDNPPIKETPKNKNNFDSQPNYQTPRNNSYQAPSSPSNNNNRGGGSNPGGGNSGGGTSGGGSHRPR